jgi:hypothetical protein
MRRQGIALLAALALASVSMAQDAPQPLRYEAHFTVKPGQEKAFVDLVKKYDQPLFEKLMAEDSLISWGIAAPVLHGRGDHFVWWVTPDYAGLDKVFAGFEEVMKQIEADGAMQDFMEAVVFEKHYDMLMRSIISNTGSIPAGTLPYISVSSWKTQPGEWAAWRKLWEKYIQPIYDQLLSDGVILAYGLDRQEEHTEDPTWRWAWYLTADLASIDRVDAVFGEARSSDAWAGIVSQFRAISVPSVHRDQLLGSLAFATTE